MGRFNYTAMRADGSKVSAVQEAPDERAVISSLRGAGLTPVSINPVAGIGNGHNPTQGPSRMKRGRRPKLQEVAIFARQLSTLLGAGVGLVNALEDLVEQMDNPRFARVLQDVLHRVMGGSALSAALREHPTVFPALVCALTRAGEESGRLDSIMADLATYLEKQVELRRKIRTAMTYPTVVFVFFCGAVAFLFLWLLPKFQSLFATLGGELPLITKYALAVSDFAQQWFPLILLALVAGGAGLYIARLNPGVRMALDRLKLKAPLFGGLMLKVAIVRFLETLATLQRSGVSILNSLEMAGETVGNRHIALAVETAGRDVAQGSLLSSEMAKNDVFPRMMVRMMAVGEETGRMEELLHRTAKYYENEVEASIQSLTSLIEPVVIVLMGVVVAFVVVSVYFPIFKIASAA